MKEWNGVKEEFEIDGSLRDIYVEDADPSLWNSFIKEIQQSPYKIEFTHGDVGRGCPGTLEEIKEMQKTNPTTLFVWVGGIQLNCHFFIDSEIELDVHPGDVQSEEAYNYLVNFLQWLSSLSEKEVKLTHEGMQEQVILSIEA